jgi:F420-non-reducing hydrogenase iron-sulfur subunit
MNTFEPKIVGLVCQWCTYTGADLAGTSRKKYQPNIRLVRLMCSGRADPAFVLKAFEMGADGVLIGGCHPGDCHYMEGNYKTLRSTLLLKQMLGQFGIEPERVRLEWISASEGERFAQVVDEFTEQLRNMGPAMVSPAKLKKVHAYPGRILVIDDEEVVGKSCDRILSPVGYQVEYVTSPKEGLEKVESEAYDLVLLDLRMPEMDGVEVLNKIKEKRPEVEVVIITAYSSVDTAVETLKTGARDYVPKPFTPEELKEVVKNALETEKET